MSVTWFLRRVALIAYPIIEILLIFWVAGLIGWGWTIVLMLAGLAVGLLLIRAAGRNALQLLLDPRRRGETFTSVDPTTGESTTLYQPPAPPQPGQVEQDARTVRESGLLVTAGVLFAVPGFISDLIGAVLALPPTRRFLSARRANRTSVTVIRGETVVSQGPDDTVVVDDSEVRMTHWDESAPGQGPTIISGEILPPPTRPEE